MPNHKFSDDDEWRRRRILLGQRLRRFRKLKGLTQRELAESLGLAHEKPLVAWERGEVEPPLWALIFLARLLSRQVIDIAAPLDDYARQLVVSRLLPDLYAASDSRATPEPGASPGPRGLGDRAGPGP
jgi:transcriptional regulator with XRE-family HTH domain